ncbi:MAG: hypothetical protein COY19_02140, partial [Candidatus Marinimicrobia bacterium CG_4_10_14_0_2_um_filter_48_9]
QRFAEITTLARVIWGHTLNHRDRKAVEKRLNDHIEEIGYYPDIIANKELVIQALYEAGEYFLND